MPRIADCKSEALAIAVNAFGARILQFLAIKSSDVRIVAPCNY